MTRRAAKRDDNEALIVEALEKAGATVYQLNRFDLLVAHGGYWYPMEVKGDRGKLTRSQVEFILDLRNRAPFHVVRTPEEALEVIGR
jgi:hypothetical protein